jgi:hypothetical protein
MKLCLLTTAVPAAVDILIRWAFDLHTQAKGHFKQGIVHISCERMSFCSNFTQQSPRECPTNEEI